MTLLADLRLLYQDESLIERLTSSAPPITSQVQEVRGRYEIKEDMEPADRVGRNLSAGLVALLGQITHPHLPDNCEDCSRNPLLNEQRTSYSPRFPVRKALIELDRMCRRRHRGPYWWDHAEQPICGLMVRDIVESGASVLWCSDRYGISYPRADCLIGAGATFVTDRLAKWDDERLGITHDPKTCDICWRTAHEVDKERTAG